ncbi:MAG: hypothetical protein ABUK01_11690 [Leptospirales bacterium]
MKYINKFLVLFILFISGVLPAWGQNISAEQVLEKKPILGLHFQSVSDYIWRGTNYFVNMYAFSNQNQKVVNFIPALTPVITWYTPVPGLRLDMGYVIPLINRDFGQGNLASVEQYFYNLRYKYINPGGEFEFGFKVYTFPTSGPLLPIESFGEFMVSYTAPILLKPNWTAHSSLGGINGSTIHHTLSIEHRFHLGLFSIMPKIVLGYMMLIQDPKLNYPYVDYMVGFNFQLAKNMKIYIRPLAVYRPFFGKGQSTLVNARGESYDKQSLLMSLTLGYEIIF